MTVFWRAQHGSMEKIMLKSDKKVGYPKQIGQQIPMVGHGEENSSGVP